MQGHQAVSPTLSRSQSKEGGASYEKELAKLKLFVRSNHWPVHHEIRANLWQTLCGVRATIEQVGTGHLSLPSLPWIADTLTL